MNRTKHYRFAASTLSIAVIAIFALYFMMHAATESKIALPIENQLQAIRSGDFTSAYEFLSERSQNSSTLAKFKDFVKTHSVLSTNSQMSLLSENIEHDSAVVKVLLTSKNGFITPATYRLSKENGDWKINFITLSLNETKEAKAYQQEAAKPLTQAAAIDVSLPNTYQSERYSFSINYPNNWEFTLPNNKSIVFSAKNSSNNLAPTLSIRPVLHQDESGKYRSVNDLLSVVMRKVSDKASDVTLVERGKISVSPARGEQLDGRYVIIRYQIQGQEYKQMEVVYYLTEDRALYALEFQAPSTDFENTLPLAKAMVQSFVFE